MGSNMSRRCHPRTPDGRYFVAKGRLWRCTDPALPEDERARLVEQLMAARRAVKQAQTKAQKRRARSGVDDAKIALGERGPVWWADGAPDESRKSPGNSRYAEWWARLTVTEREAGS